MSILDLARPDLRGFRAYRSARSSAPDQGVLLNANEWPWPPFAGGDGLNRYPQPQPPALLSALADQYRWRADGILAGRGSDEAIDLLLRGFCRAGEDAIGICPPTFGMYRICAQIQGAGVIEVPLLAEQDFAIDAQAVLAAVEREQPKIVFLCSPNNPTGQQTDRESLLALVDAIGERALVIVDEAYVEFAPGSSLVDALASRPQLALLRTLSKAYGLAAVRLGVLLAAPELISFLRALMAPYPLPAPCVALALQALAPDQTEARQQRLQQIIAERERLAKALRGSPLVTRVWPSDANFLCFQCHDSDALLQHFTAHGLVLRDVSDYLGLSQCLRLSIGTPDENDAVLAALAQAVPAVTGPWALSPGPLTPQSRDHQAAIPPDEPATRPPC